MDNLEHKIKNAFSETDAGMSLAGKEAMWNRIEDTMHRRKGVAAGWRVAAVLAVLLFASGVFATLNFRAKQNRQIMNVEMENRRLQQTVDSLLLIPTETEPKPQVVEKIIYRDRFVQPSKNSDQPDWQEKYRQLQDSTKNILANQEQFYYRESEQLQNQLLAAKAERDSFRQKLETQVVKSEEPPFQLKSGRVKMGVQQNSSERNPELELKIFPKNFIQKTNDLNQSLFKK